MKNAALLLILALACALAACNNTNSSRTLNDADVVDEYEQNPVDRASLPMSDFRAEDVISAVSDAGGLTKLPKDLATKVIDDYMMRLADVTAAAPLMSDLKLVRSEINSGIIDRGEVGRALIRLGTQTRLIAADDSAYNLLGSALKSSGEQLVGENPEPDMDRG